MWKYNNTDEMYTGKYDRSEKLYHSDVYLGQDYTDGIYHFKYIKREKVNGKWVYYYKDDLLDKARTNKQAAIDRYVTNANTMDNASKTIKRTSDNINKRANYKGGKVSTFLKKQYTKADTARKKLAEKSYTKSKAESDQALKDIDKETKKIKKLKNTDKFRKNVAKGTVAVANMLSNAGYKAKKTAKKVKKKLDTAAVNALSKGHIKYGHTEKENKTGGTDERHVRKSNKLLSDSYRIKTRVSGALNYGSGSTSWDSTYNDEYQNIGKIEQAVDKKKKQLYKKYKKKYEKTYGKTK